MPTTVHIPPGLLSAAERRARALGISRNRLIIQALEREVGEAQVWSEEFLAALRKVDHETTKAAEEMLRDIVKHRRSKQPPKL